MKILLLNVTSDHLLSLLLIATLYLAPHIPSLFHPALLFSIEFIIT